MIRKVLKYEYEFREYRFKGFFRIFRPTPELQRSIKNFHHPFHNPFLHHRKVQNLNYVQHTAEDVDAFRKESANAAGEETDAGKQDKPKPAQTMASAPKTVNLKCTADDEIPAAVSRAGDAVYDEAGNNVFDEAV